MPPIWSAKGVLDISSVLTPVCLSTSIVSINSPTFSFDLSGCIASKNSFKFDAWDPPIPPISLIFTFALASASFIAFKAILLAAPSGDVLVYSFIKL